MKSGSKKNKKPWLTKDAMKQVYEMNLWGGSGTDFYSGSGSHRSEIVDPYIEVVSSFLKSIEKPPVVCDLGCGDFNVGKQLVPFAKQYIAVDIVEDLIHHNKKKFKAENLEFHCLDMAKDELPEGDCALVRHVLQHLSNVEIKHIIPKLVNYRYVIVTEHLPEGTFEPNQDIISGQGIRLKNQSGVDLEAPPFEMKIKNEKQLLSVLHNEFGGCIVTTLYEMY